MSAYPIAESRNGLNRQMGIMGLAATGICSMVGAGINVVPFMIQKNVAGIGPYVLPAYLFAAIPAVFAALAYAILSSAMPRAGGSYVHVSRALHPYLGFVASFSQWFGLSIAVGVVSYILIPFLRDIAFALEWHQLAFFLDDQTARLLLALAFLWMFVVVNLQGIKIYERTLIPLMFMMFGLGAIVIVAGFYFNQSDFVTALEIRENRLITEAADASFNWGVFVTAATLLFSSFIGFDSIAQAGGEAKNPAKSLPLAIGIAIFTVGAFYFLFTMAVYHAVPWDFIAVEAQTKDLSAPGMLSYLLPTGWAVAIVAGAAVALINDLPAMILAVSRLMFAWAEDGIFPKAVSKIHPVKKTPQTAIIISGIISSIGIIGCYLASDFFLGIDILVTSMLVNFLLMVIAVASIHKRNPAIAADIKVIRSARTHRFIATTGGVLLAVFLLVHVYKDLSTSVKDWYFHSTFIWLVVMALGSIVYFSKKGNLKKQGVDIKERFSTLPEE